jgi:CpeT protein|tara:strand:+ start:8997 stop:9527 length:531 start_codon:yes stop_codon:yes gene_type:complete
MSQFLELLVGTFNNKRQAQSHPTRYAHIRVQHRLIGENRIYGEQAYNYLLNRPYRQFVIDVVEEIEGDEYRLKNYEINNPLQFAECREIETITDDLLTYREGCDIIMRRTGKSSFFGGTSTCQCWVTWNGTKTYVQNEVTLNDKDYHVVDKGLHEKTHQRIWGSEYGAFKFVRLPS